MYKHFGTPTKNYGSGTEEEFYKAYDLHVQSPKEISIQFYFNSASIPQNNFDTEQYEKVSDFKEIISELGCLYQIYEGENDFKDKLRKNFLKYFSSIYAMPDNAKTINEITRNKLEERLNKSLVGYFDQNVNWIERAIYKTDDSVESFNDAEKVDISSLIKKPHSLLIETPPQFGLTCFAHYLILEASKLGDQWIYLDAHKIRTDLNKAVEKACNDLQYNKKDISCIILDSWVSSGEGMMKTLKKICHEFENIPIFIMSSEAKNLISSRSISQVRDFQQYSMLPLTKNNIREMVSSCSKIQNDETVLNKIILDFKTLNIHRTPENCLSLLKILENPSLENPINRAKMLSMLLTVIFDFTKYPAYSKKPDLEHCEFILGSYCKKMINKRVFDFTKDDFIQSGKESMEKQKLNIDVYAIFDVLLDNNILISEGSKFRFRYAFWVYYFLAKRMKSDREFRTKILKDQEYISFVEMIEFYSGIVKDDNELTDLLIKDLQEQCDKVENATGLVSPIDPLKALKWEPSDKEISDSFQMIKDEVISSNLPSAIKDSYADSTYNLKKSYNQNINQIYQIYKDYHVLILKEQIHICSRVLRNSDFIESEKKEFLLQQIMRGLHLISKLIFALTPILAQVGKISIDGFGVILSKHFDDISEGEKVKQILILNPQNIINLFFDDLYSERLSLVFFDMFDPQKSTLINHFIILLLIKGKPDDWEKYFEKYIKSIDANSAHLLDTINSLLRTYQYDDCSIKQLKEVKDSIYLAYTRKKSPNSKHLQDEKKSLLKTKKFGFLSFPKRLIDDE